MSRLERQITSVRRRLTLRRFVHAVGWAALGVAGGVWMVILSDRLFGFGPAGAMRWWGLGAAVTAGVLAALVWAVLNRPAPLAAARAIDSELGTRDRFATALYFQNNPDAFARAAREDAEAAAEHISIRRRFRPEFPRTGYWAAGLVAVVLLTLWLMPPMDLAHHRQSAQKQARQAQASHEAKEAVKQALAQVRSVPKQAADEQSLKQAADDLKALLDQPDVTPAEAHRKALEALQGVDESMRQTIRNSEQFAQLQQQKELMKSLEVSDHENVHLKAAKQAMKQGNYSQAAREMRQAEQQYQSMTPSQQQAMAKQMRDMADQLRQASDPRAQAQRMQQQLQQMGASQAQAQQMTQQLQQAAQGDAAAKQQLQQTADQLSQKAGSASERMRQRLQQALTRMQGDMAARQAAQKLAQSADRMSQAMSQGNPQQMNSAGESMQQQLGQMGDMQQNLQQMQAMQQAMSQAASRQQVAANGGRPGTGGGQGDQAGAGRSPGAASANGGGQGGSQAGVGHAEASPADHSTPAAYKTQAELAPQQANEKSPKLAGDYVSAPPIKGESHIKMSQLRQATAQEAAQSSELQHIPPPVREAVKAYFDFSQ